MVDRFRKDYVVVMIDTDRMTHGKAVAAELRGSERGGIPWMVIRDGGGKAVITSDGPGGNVGCPASDAEVAWFLKMVDQTRKHMSAADRRVFELALRENGKRLSQRRGRAKGARAFVQAVTLVKSGAFAEAMQHLGKAFATGYPVGHLFTNPGLWQLREDPECRKSLFEQVRKHVASSQATLVDALEVGRDVRLNGKVVDKQSGKALPHAVIKFYHTDHSGEYRPGMDAGGGAGNPRLWGCVKADAEGCFRLDTVMPERYPNSSVPRHIHYRVWAEGHATLDSECFFHADPLLSDATRESAAKKNFPIVTLKLAEDGRQTGELTIRVPK